MKSNIITEPFSINLFEILNICIKFRFNLSFALLTFPFNQTFSTMQLSYMVQRKTPTSARSCPQPWQLHPACVFCRHSSSIRFESFGSKLWWSPAPPSIGYYSSLCYAWAIRFYFFFVSKSVCNFCFSYLVLGRAINSK